MVVDYLIAMQLMKNWTASYFGNLVASLVMVGAILGTGLLAGNTMPINMAVAKTSLPWGVAFLRAVLCNWLVCLAVWQAAAASSLPGKLMGLWPPITTFVTIGLEHSVANMFFIPCGIAMGAKVSISDFIFNNLIPVTLGNTVGAFLFVATAYSWVYGSLGKPKPKAAAATA